MKKELHEIRNHEVKLEEPTIIGVWIFLNSGQCLFHYGNKTLMKEEHDQDMITSLLSAIDSLFSETREDRCNVIFGYKTAYYYNYLGIHNVERNEPAYLICVIGTRLSRGFSLSDMLAYEKLSLKSGQILVSFFTRYTDNILPFHGRVEEFNDFHVECVKLLRNECSSNLR